MDQPTPPAPPQRSTDVIERESQAPDSVSILVARNDLKSVVDNGLRKVSWLTRRNPLFRRKRVRVEAAPHTAKDRVFYAPDVAVAASRVTPTQSVKVDPNVADGLVRRGDPFEITFVGMSATPKDTFRSNFNELFLYSLTHDPVQDPAPRSRSRDPGASSGDPVAPEIAEQPALAQVSTMSTANHLSVPTGFYAETGVVPFIHYDPVVDGHDAGTEPDAFVPIPATKRLYKRSNGTSDRDGDCMRSVIVRFHLIEIDKVSDLQARAISGVDQLGSFVSGAAPAVPYLELLTRAFAVASSLGKAGLKEYAKPDHVLSADEEFLLAEPEEDADEHHTGPSNRQVMRNQLGNYLRYGYYYFLNKNVDSQLYAQTSSSCLSMPLMLKREDLTGRRARKNEKLFFPLTGVSYLVMKVSPGCTRNGIERTKAVHDAHARRLQNMLQMSNAIEMLASMEKKKRISVRRPGKKGNSS